MKTTETILIILIAGIGDLILASKSIRAIRKGFPNADIHLLTSTEASPIAQNYSYLDHVWAFPITELRENRSKILSMLKLIRKLRKIDFGIVVNFYRVISWAGAMKMGFLFFFLRAKVRIGQKHKGFGLFLDKKVPVKTFQNRHFTDAMMDMALLAGGESNGHEIEVFWDKRSEKNWGYLFPQKKGGLQGLKIGINPGGSKAKKRWHPDKFARVADQLPEYLKAQIVLLGGPGEENIAQHIQKRMEKDAINLAGHLTLNDLVYVISRLDLLITNDSGPMHIAAAVKTPLVALFGPEIPAHTRPYTEEELYRVIHKDLNCRPCNSKKCKRSVCLDLVTPEEVIEKCREILNPPQVV